MRANLHRARLTLGVTLSLMCAARVAPAQNAVATAARRPHAAPLATPTPPTSTASGPSGRRSARAAAIGAVAGGALGGVLGARFAQGQCERPGCDEWRRGLVAGALVGAAIGAVIGLAVAR